MWAFLNHPHSLFRLVEKEGWFLYAFPICFLFLFFYQTYISFQIS